MDVGNECRPMMGWEVSDRRHSQNKPGPEWAGPVGKQPLSHSHGRSSRETPRLGRRPIRGCIVISEHTRS